MRESILAKRKYNQITPFNMFFVVVVVWLLFHRSFESQPLAIRAVAVNEERLSTTQCDE